LAKRQVTAHRLNRGNFGGQKTPPKGGGDCGEVGQVGEG